MLLILKYCKILIMKTITFKNCNNNNQIKYVVNSRYNLQKLKQILKNMKKLHQKENKIRNKYKIWTSIIMISY